MTSAVSTTVQLFYTLEMHSALMVLPFNKNDYIGQDNFAYIGWRHQPPGSVDFTVYMVDVFDTCAENDYV